MEEQSAKRNSINRILLVIVLMLAILNVVQYYIYRGKEGELKEVGDSRKEELFSTYTKLDSISTQLTSKIQEIGRLGGNVDSLLVIQKELERDKDQLKLQRNLAESKYNQIKDKIEAYEFLLKRKDEEIAKLKEVNEELLSEVIEKGQKINVLTDRISDLEYAKEELVGKVQSASSLRTRNIRFTAISDKNKERLDSEFKVRQLSILKTDFNFEENNLAEIGAKEMFMRLIDPDGSVLYKVGSGAQTFMYKGKELFYSVAQDVLFDNTQQQITFYYEKGSDFKKGQYTVEFYCEGALIGGNTFIVK